MGRHKLPEGHALTEHISLPVSNGMRQKLEDIAIGENRTIAQVVRIILEKGLKDYGEEET